MCKSAKENSFSAQNQSAMILIGLLSHISDGFGINVS